MPKALWNLSQEDWRDFQIARTPGETEHWRIRHFETTPKAPEYMRLVLDGRDPGLGDFTALHFRVEHPDYAKVRDEIEDESDGWTVGEWVPMMSDTKAEILDHYDILDRAAWGEQYVLITGLGLGMVAEAALDFGNTVDVIERDQEVIDLIGPQIAHPNLRIIKADALTYVPERKYDLLWHDIWPTLTMANLPAMRKMRRHYRRYMVGGGWQGFWGWEQCLHMERMEMRTDPSGIIRFLGPAMAAATKQMWLVNPALGWEAIKDMPPTPSGMGPRQIWQAVTGTTPPGERVLP